MTTADLKADSPSARLATRLAFFAAGFAVAAWSPLVPYAKARLGVDEAGLGVLLLCLGIGSVIAMPITGGLANRWGSRRIILLSGSGLVLMLPLLAIVSSPWVFAVVLTLFGASLGTIDVAMNVHGSEVERDAGLPLMSGFHGLFSVGGFAGSAGVTWALSLGLTPITAAMIAASAVAVLLVLAAPRLLAARAAGGGPIFVWPHGIVVLIAAICCVLFLMEGAILDWGALFLIEARAFPPAQGGLGYMLFAIAMTAGRLSGDRIVGRLGIWRVLFWGGLLTAAGFGVLVTVPNSILSLAGFLLIGIGAANLVPVLFSAVGRQRAMPAGLAIASITTAGYAGNLLGPAAVGFIAHSWNLSVAFGLLGVLVLPLPLLAGRLARI